MAQQNLTATTLTPPLKWHGGKSYLARRIVALMPRHLHYVEPFAGGLAVLLERDPNDRKLWASDCAQRGGVSEVVNDLSGDLTNFWRVLQHPGLFPVFQRRCQATPLSRLEFDQADLLDDTDSVSRAWAFFVRCRQSRAGTFKGFTSLTRSRTRRHINGNASEWLGSVEGLAAIHARLIPVVVENLDAVKLIPREDTPETLFYCDPPYLHETRVSTNAYAHEMTAEQHRQLLNVLLACKGKVILSGYPNELYDRALSQWRRVDVDIANHAAGGESKRRMTECLWLNYEQTGSKPATNQSRGDLFGAEA